MELSVEDSEILRELEESLWVPEKRFDRDYMEKVLAPEFFEFGRSGRIYTREETISAPFQEISIKLPLKNFKAHTVSENVVLVTYVSEVFYEGLLISNRTSLWLKTPGGWKLRFHQGTPVNIVSHD